MAKYNPKIEVVEERVAVRMRDGLEAKPDTKKWIWRLRTLMTAGCCQEILAISFSPTNFTVAQRLYTGKLQSDESIEEKQIFSHRTIQHRFLLPAEQISATFDDLSKIKTNLTEAINASVAKLPCEVDEKTKAVIKSILERFYHDKEANGLGVALKQGSYVWLK
ncbi:MAG: hypothetical protein ABSA17_05300 [Rhabdochlamydiaceae bacterium]|jgi:hypothetical protein